MIIYVIEREFSDIKPDPELLLNGMVALKKVKDEFIEVLAKENIDPKNIDKQTRYECIWMVDEKEYEGTAKIDSIFFDSSRYEWRITKHSITV